MKRVIIADDSSLARMFIAKSLATAGYINFTIEEAKDGQEVFALAQEKHTDLIITDLNMPEMNGLELLEHLSKLEEKIPTIVVTSGGNSKEREEILNYGVLEIVSKPLTPSDLIHSIGELLDKGEGYYD